MKNRLVYGVGINDADYATQVFENVVNSDGKLKRKLIWVCPYYQTWKSMLERCYSKRFQSKYPTYKGCTLHQEWLKFTKFRKWMENQDHVGKQIDKDLLYPGNKVYSPDTCVFVSRRVNTFVVESGAIRGEYPIGVSYMKKPKGMINERTKPYVAQISDCSGRKMKYLGYFSTPEEAHRAWLTAKLEQAKELASEILSEGGDPRIAKALVERYENYKEGL